MKSCNKPKKIELNKVCRTCLTETTHLRDIFSTKIPMLIEYCSNLQVTEDDGLPKHICVSCFHQIYKFYNFKRKMERSDRTLRNYIKQKNKVTVFSDILHKAVNDAQIGLVSEELTFGSEKTMLSETRIKLNEKDMQTASKREMKSYSNTIKDAEDNKINNLDSDQSRIKIQMMQGNSNTILPLLSDEPPPLVPLIQKVTTAIPSDISKNLPENTPPLIPIKSPPNHDLDIITQTEMPLPNKNEFDLCEKNAESLKIQESMNSSDSSLQCNICKKEFKERKRLIGHLKGHMVAKHYGCKICGKRYPNPSTFRVHMRTHTGERPFKCHICNKGFVRWAGVVGHMKTHNPLKPYECDICGKGFKISSNLERHKVLHSDNLPYQCSYCGKSFCQSDNLQLHIRTYHTYEKPFLCNMCGKSFVSSTRLRRHMWVHTGYKPYTCSICTKAYSNSNDLKNHERTHSGNLNEENKQYECSICNMKFFHQCRLAKHLKTHDKGYVCVECNKGFTSEELCNKHMNSKHGINSKDIVTLPVNEVYFSIE